MGLASYWISCLRIRLFHLFEGRKKKNNDLHGIVYNLIETPYKEYSIHIDHYYDGNCNSYVCYFCQSVAERRVIYLVVSYNMQKGQT